MRVYKYILSGKTTERLNLPKGAKLLSTIEQHGRIVVYALVDPTETDKQEYEFAVLRTGWDPESVEVEKFTPLGTIDFYRNGSLIFHVFYREINHSGA